MGCVAVFPCGCRSIFPLLSALGWKLVGCPGPKGRGGDLGNHFFHRGSSGYFLQQLSCLHSMPWVRRGMLSSGPMDVFC